MNAAIGTLEVYPVDEWLQVPHAQIVSLKGSWETGGSVTGIAFGDDSDITLDGELNLAAWDMTGDFIPVRYFTDVNGVDAVTFVGIMTARSRTLTRLTFRAEGIKIRIAATKTYSPMLERRPLFTKTHATSADDPDDGAWDAGLGNYLFWQAGGRPAEQSAGYPDAVFFYSCDHAILAPDYSWTAGEDSWAEGLRLAEASGGQLYQDADGVVRYRQILGYGGGVVSETMDESTYATIEQAFEPELLAADVFTCQYLPRRRLGVQQIADDTTPVHIEPGESATIVIEPEQPIVSLETDAGLLPASAIVVALQDGTRLVSGAGFSHTLDIKAARITIVVTNESAWPAIVYRVVLRGTPIVAGEAGSVSSGSGAIERQLEQSVYIQSRADAQRSTDMALAFYGAARAQVRLGDVLHKPARALGDTVALTCAQWSMTAQHHVILRIEHAQGTRAGVTLADVSDLPAADQFFQVGTTYTGATEKYLAW